MQQLFSHDVVVVAIPAFNEERYIGEAIASLKAQEWPDFLVLISDNASNDRTEEICRSEIAGDRRFHYVRHRENRGSAGNAKWTFCNTDSPYFMWLGAHDKIHADFLSTHIRALQAHPEYSLSYSLTQWIDENGQRTRVTDPSALADIRGGSISRFFKSIRCLSECTAINNVIRRSMFSQNHIWDVAGSDKVMLSELLYRGPAHRIEQPHYLRREFSRRVSDYMERLTGKQGLEYSERQLIPAYLVSFDRVAGRSAARFLVRSMLESLLEQKFAGRLTTRDRVYKRVMQGIRL